MTNDNTKKIKLQVAEQNIKIHHRRMVKVIKQGDRFADVTYTEKKSKSQIKKLSKTEYLVLKTGEIKKYKEGQEKRQDSLRDTFGRLRQLIRTNFTQESYSQLSITLTYAENMQDEKRLLKDFELFYKRLKYAMKGHKLEYIVVAEPQERGAWHMHLMLKSDQPHLYIDNRDITSLWGHGFTETKRLKSDDVGAYYVAYFTDLTTEAKGVTPDEQSKARQKGARLKYYPKHFKFYRYSRGMKKPEKSDKPYEEVQKEFGEPKSVVTYELIETDEDGKESVINTIQKEFYKKPERGVEHGKGKQ